MANQAAWLTGPGVKPFNVAEAPFPSPGPGEIAIRNYATAVNPIEVFMQGGMMIETYPTILGTDIAGEVVDIGTGVTRFQKGDRVLAMANGTHNLVVGGERKKSNMAFQQVVCTSERIAAVIPPGVTFVDACVLPLALSTAAAGLFQKECLSLPAPKVKPETKNKVVLIWGGSSSVGSCAIQLAHAAGFEVATTASNRNHDYCASLGASIIVDHGNADVVEDLITRLKGKELAGVFSVIMDPSTVIKCAQVMAAHSSVKFVQTVFAPGMPDIEGLPEGFTIGRVFASTLQENEVGDLVWGQWVTEALEAGSLQCKPKPLVVGKGLDQLQSGVDKAATGVSAQKIVVEL